MWILFALLSGLFYTISGLVSRYILKGDQDAWAFSFYFSAIGAAVILPFALTNFKIPESWLPWGVMVLVGGGVVLHNWLSFRASNFLEASVVGTLTKARLVWVLLLSALFLGERLTSLNILGTAVTIASSWILLGQFKNMNRGKGVVFILAATVIYSLLTITTKYLLNFYSPSTMTFFIFLVPAVLNFIVMPNAWERIYTLFTTQSKQVALACVTGGLANIAMFQAFSLGSPTAVIVIIEAFLVVTLIGEQVILKETQFWQKKVIAVTLAVVGAILLTLTSN